MEWDNEEPWLELRYDQIPNPHVAAALLSGLVIPVNWMREFSEGGDERVAEAPPALFPAIDEVWERHSEQIVEKGGTPTVDQYFGQLVTYYIP